MTIIQLTGSLAGGGAENMVLQLSRKSLNEYPTKVISVSKVNTLEPKFNEAGIKCHFLNVDSFKNFSIFRGLRIMHELVKDEDDPIIHAHLFHAGIVGVLYKIFYRNIPLVFTLHSSTVDNLLRKIALFILKPFRRSDVIFSRNTSQWFMKNSDIIPNGVDFDELELTKARHYDYKRPFRFLFLARYSEVKNPLKTVDLVKELISRGLENFEIQLVGGGHKGSKLEELIKKNNLELYFKLEDFQNDIKGVLKDADCLIILSRREGLPMVLIEAAATRLPIISTPVGSIPEILDETNGRLSELHNFHEAMSEVIQDYPEALNRANRLYDQLKSKFSIDSVYRQHIDMYKSVLEK